MRTSWRSELALSMFVLSMQVCWFGDSQCSRPQPDSVCTVNPHDLRSAFLLREGMVNYQGQTASEHQAELQRHFDAVLPILEHNTPLAIEIALDRLEASQSKAWSPAERERYREELLASRELQLERLRAYRDRGLFPQNEGHADHAVPIFVDNHDTACAVGHLMRLAGWEEKVAEIQASNNLVYVPDAADSSVAKWALTAGVTLEEAALIQPGYEPPPAEHRLVDLLNMSSTIEDHGVKYSGFTYEMKSFEDVNFPNRDSPLCGIIACDPSWIQVDTQSDPGDVGVRLDTGIWWNGFDAPGVYPLGSNWAFIGAVIYNSDGTFSGALPLSSEPGKALQIKLGFDLEPVDSSEQISSVTQGESSIMGGFGYIGEPYGEPPPEFGEYYLRTSVLGDGAILGAIEVDQDNPASHQTVGSFGIETIGFTPKRKIRVETEMWVSEGYILGSYYLDFSVVQVVPEPSSWFLLLTGMLSFAMVLRKRVQRSKNR